jgi:O-antigen/teichoic acid export membrane protein
VEAYGNWSLFISMIGLVLTFSSMNLMYASNVLLTGKDRAQQKREIYSVSLTKGCATLVVYSGFAGYLSYHDVFAPTVLGLMFVALVFRTVNDLCFGLCRALLLIPRQVLFLLVESVLIILAVLTGCYYFDGGLESALYGFIIAEFIAMFLGVYLLKEYIGYYRFDFGIVKKYLAIGLPLIPFAFSDLIVNSLVPLLLKLYDSFESVAFYSIAQKVALVATIPTAIVNNVYAQYLRKSRSSANGAGVRRTFLTFLSIYLSMVLPLLMFMYLFGKDIIVLVSTAEYVQSYNLMLLLVVVNMLVSVSALLTTLFAVFERTRTVGFIWLGVLALFVAISGYCFDRWQIEGIAYALIISFGLGLLSVSIAVSFLRRTIRRERNTNNPV